MYSTSYYGSSSSVNSMVGAGIWTIIALVLSIVGGILIYFLFLNKKNEGKFKNAFVNWLYDFLSFKKMFLEALLKITYLIVALFITLGSFALIGSSFLGFLATLVIGNLVARVIYEFSLILLVICRNTTEMAKAANKEEKK